MIHFFLSSKNNSWERRYASLSDSYFNVYTNSSKANNVLEHSIDLNALNVRRKVILEPLQSEIGVSVAKSDLPFVIKFEVSSDCWPMGSLVFMALSMEDRDKWFKGELRIRCIFCCDCVIFVHCRL